MATNADFPLFSKEDCAVTVSLAPPTSIAGWAIEFSMQRYFGPTQSGSLLKSCASGYSGVSGIIVTNSGQGVISIDIDSRDTSGLPFGNYAYNVTRTDQRTVLSIGFVLVGPDIG